METAPPGADGSRSACPNIKDTRAMSRSHTRQDLGAQRPEAFHLSAAVAPSGAAGQA